jgi:hypothetical protein
MRTHISNRHSRIHNNPNSRRGKVQHNATHEAEIAAGQADLAYMMPPSKPISRNTAPAAYRHGGYNNGNAFSRERLSGNVDLLADAALRIEQRPSHQSHANSLHFYDHSAGSVLSSWPSSQLPTRTNSDSASYYAPYQYASPYVYKSNDSGYGGSPAVTPPKRYEVFESNARKANPRPTITSSTFDCPRDEGHVIDPKTANGEVIEFDRTKSASLASPAASHSPATVAASTNQPLSSGYAAEQAPTSAYERNAGFVKQWDEQPRSQEGCNKKAMEDSEAKVNSEANAKQLLLVSPKVKPFAFPPPGLVLQMANEEGQDCGNESPLATITEGIATLRLNGKDTDQDHHPLLQLPMVNHPSGSEVHIMQWVDATKDVDFDSLTPAESQCISTDSGICGSTCNTIAQEEPPYSTKAMVTEVMYILRNQLHDSDTDILLPDAKEETYTRPTTDGLESPKSGTRSASAQSGSSSAQSSPSNAISRLPFKSFDRGEDGEPPTKKSGGSHGPYTYDTPPRVTLKSQMPCPISDSLGCMGTNPTISEMLRSLQNRHRIVICTDCCSKLEVPDQERKPENILKRHATKGCERRCICQGYLDMDQAASKHHRRTEKCPNWKALSKEIRWSFVWGLLNPGLEPPSPEFISGTGYEHSSVLTPCKEKPRDRGLELCRTVMADLDVKTERLQSLEHELEASKQQNFQIQQHCDDKIANLENIIETLLERLRDKNVDIPPSLHKRLTRECPGCIIPSTSSQIQKPLTPESTPEKMASLAQPYNGPAVRCPAWDSSLFDPSSEVPDRQAAAQQQQLRAEVPISTTQTTATQSATTGDLPDGAHFEEFFNAPMNTNAEFEGHGLSWGMY